MGQRGVRHARPGDSAVDRAAAWGNQLQPQSVPVALDGDQVFVPITVTPDGRALVGSAIARQFGTAPGRLVLYEIESRTVTEIRRLPTPMTQVIEAFISGQVNVIHLLSPMTVWARYGSKVPAKVVAWNHVGGSGLTVAPYISDMKQLGGKTVAIPFWYSIHNVVLQQMLNDNGLTPVSKPANAPLAGAG